MKKLFLKIKNFVLNHKIISAIVLIIIIFAGYQMMKSFTGSATQTLYTLGTVERGTVISSVSGTGQVSAINQIDLKIKASGNITYLNAKVGQTVKAGTLIAQVDTTDAAYELENAKLSYDKLVTVDPVTLQKDKNTVTQVTADLKNSYVNARTALVTALSDMSSILNGLIALFDFNTGYLTEINYSLGDVVRSYQTKAENSNNSFKNLLNDLKIKYVNLSPNATDSDLESLVSEFYSTALASTQATKDAQDAIIYMMDNSATTDSKNQAKANSAYTSIVSLVSTANGVVSNLSSIKNSINNNKINLQNTTTDLSTLVTGPDTLTLRQSQLAVNQAKTALDNCSIVAPFDGVIASVPVNNGDTLSNGDIVATLVTKQEMAKISLNEIDAANVKVGQKATATFDAIPDLTITGKVTSVDLIGTVSQGVVSYNVQISFDVNDDRIKPGMSVSASIITEAKADVLTVANSAIKTQGDSNYVEIPGATVTDLPAQQIVTVGISNDTVTEIVSGLKEGDSVVTKTTTGIATQVTTKTPSVSSILGGGRPR